MAIIRCPSCKSQSMVMLGEKNGIRKYECLKCQQPFYPMRITQAQLDKINELAAQREREEARYRESVEEKLTTSGRPSFKIYLP